MDPFRLLTLAKLMRATPKQANGVLAERPKDAEVQFAVVTYSKVYTLLKRNATNPVKAMTALIAWRDQEDISDRSKSFRRNAFPDIEWCVASVLPRIRRVIRVLDGDRQKTGRLLNLEGHDYFGGFHVWVEWEDGSERLIYFVASDWSLKLTRNMLALLQLKAVQVYQRFPQSVVVVHIKRRRVFELMDIDPDDRDEALRVAAWLRENWRQRPAA